MQPVPALQVPTPSAPPGPSRPWRERLAHLVETMRDMSRHTDPQAMVEEYGERMRGYFQYDRMISLSRRDLAWPAFRITRSSTWEDTPDPWRERHRLPLIKGGVLADLIYGDQPQLINDLQIPADDPAAEYLQGMRSALALPHYDKGVGLNMVVTMRREPHSFVPETIPEIFWMSNLFGRATGNLALSRQLQEAKGQIERELRVVAEIQKSLLPVELPKLKTLELAAYYQTSQNAGGDYYDFFDLGPKRLGILIADVAGHGTPAAVLMAILHAIAHLAPREECCPGRTLEFINRHLAKRYTGEGGTFVTAFYGVYEEDTRTLRYCSAGHPPPLVAACGDPKAGMPRVRVLDAAQGLPMGIDPGAEFPPAKHTFEPGDTLVLYTDGITEARGPSLPQEGGTAGGTHRPKTQMYGEVRLGAAVGACPMSRGEKCTAENQLNAILRDVHAFTADTPISDDRTMVVGMIR